MSSWLDQTLGGIGQGIGGAWNTATHWFDNPADNLLQSIDRGNAQMAKGYGAATAPAPKVDTSQNDAYLKQFQAQNSQIQNLIAQLNAAPKLPSYDILGNYNKAKQQATANVTPLYDQKLQQFLDAQATETANKQASASLNFENNGIAQTNTLADNTTSRDRTGTDLLSALQLIQQDRGNFLQSDGNQFDVARRSLQGSTAAAGATDTGLGQQAIDTQLTNRNISADRQMQTFVNSEAAKNTAASRTLQDLSTSDTRAGQQKTQADKGVQLDLNAYLDGLTNATASKRLELDQAKASDIAGQTGDISKQLAQQFIASLAKKGARAQDIALAQSVYGG